MKKVLLIILGILLVAAGVMAGMHYYHNYSDDANEYYCPPNASADEKYDIEDLYIPKENKCATLKKEQPEKYEKCIEQRNLLKERYASGLCDEVVVEDFELKGTLCRFQYSPKYKKFIGAVCAGEKVKEVKETFIKEKGLK